jgi:pilus assembly protein FimV
MTDDGTILFEPLNHFETRPIKVPEDKPAATQFENSIEWESDEVLKATRSVETPLGLDVSDTLTTLEDDDIATRLELARAYMDIGDKEGAREVLDEVLGLGNSEQREEATALLKAI